MAWTQDTDKQTKQKWQSRFAKERLNLSASVEEALAEPSIQEDLLSEEDDAEDNAVESASKPHSATIIPPKLSLQSKSLPAVQVESPKPAQDGQLETSPAHLTRPVEAPTKGQKKQRLGRTTKVRLQAVPKTEKKSGGRALPDAADFDHQQPALEDHQAKARNDGQLYADADAGTGMEGQVNTRGKLSGSGVFKRGQEKITVTNPLISSTSVVIVTLIGDPGPVVVHYVTLQPQTGFTIHLSAPAMKQTAFNYVILMTELF